MFSSHFLGTVPLALALPATLASLLYLDGRWRISPDVSYVRAALRTKFTIDALEPTGELHMFSALEELALNRQPTKYRQNRIAKRGAKISEQICLIFEGKQWTYRQVYDEVLRVAGWLNRRIAGGIKKGEIVAMNFTNTEHFIFLWFAIWSLGAVPAFINFNLRGEPLVHSIKISGTRMVIVDEEVVEAFTDEVRAKIGEGVDVVAFDENVKKEIEMQTPYLAPREVRLGLKRSDPAILIYTSGTTGLPKPAVVTGWKPYVGFTLVSTWISCTPADRIYCSMPLYHSSASLLSFLCALGSGCPFVLGRRFSLTNFWPEVRSSGATIIQYVGETLRYLLSAPPSPLDTSNSVRLALGNGLRPDIWETFKTRFDIATIAEFYAATESTDGFWNLSSNTFTSGAVGSKGLLRSLLSRNRTAIISLDIVTEEPVRDPRTGLCVLMPPGQPGEMVFNISDDPLRTPQERFAGYFNNASASAKKMLFDVVKPGDAWYRTGDLMIQDSEGRTFFSDRLGDSFRWKSENVSTNEVAEALGRFPAVVEANVYGVLIPHHDGRAGCAAVVFKGDHIPEPDDQLMRRLAKYLVNDSGLPRYAVPVFVRVMKSEEMERTGNNKQNKQTLRVEGVDLERFGGGGNGDEAKKRVWWLRGGEYVRFGMEDSEALKEGRIRL